MNKHILFSFLILAFASAHADQQIKGDFLIKFKPGKMQLMQFQSLTEGSEGKIDVIDNQWLHVKVAEENLSEINSDNVLNELNSHPDIEYAQPNYMLGLIEDYQSDDPTLRKIAEKMLSGQVVEEFLPQSLNSMLAIKDPAVPSPHAPMVFGKDPLLSKQWSMKSISADQAWQKTKGSKDIVVAVIDTGVDYTHEDLKANLWRSPKDQNVVGWDFVDNDSKPYDIAKSTWQIVLSGGNPGHGTHCAGMVGASANNGKGIVGVSPNVSLMVLRFLNEKGQGTTADAVKAINYAVENGANILSNSWGSAGENPNENNQALKDAITNALNKNVLFVAAAGNGRGGKGYNNDTDARPSYPATYPMANIISVAAIDKNDQLGKFSNFGAKTVHVGAPGVQILSTVASKKKYSDTVVNLGFQKITWDGTSMATPHVAGAAAQVWAAHPEYTVLDVKNALLNNVDKIAALEGKTVSGGKINVAKALK
ncbi:MAG: S8 family serine peptidase [Oligoflexia bacterium]|nr:S8 family serine peptidase [Oligoflexia bacterium]